jgi:TonB-linked SusC/RagA family outer membrane protein
MIKKSILKSFFSNILLKKLGSIFLLTTIFLIGFNANASVSSSTQDVSVSLNFKKAAVKKVLGEIRKQTSFDFLYSKTVFDDSKQIDAEYKKEKLSVVMDDLFGEKYSIVYKKNIVIISKKKEAAKQAEKITVKGTVTDQSGEPLPGVTVVIVGSTNGVITNIDGKYSILVKKGAKLQYSFVGFDSQVKTVVDSKKINVKLKAKVEQLNSVVCTGYKKTTVERATGSVGVVTAKELANKPTPQLEDILQGKIAGVNIRRTSGRPGAASKITIRGENSLTGDTGPLWVVDGVPLQRSIPNVVSNQIKSGDYSSLFNNGVGGINPNDIENVTILKDASAAAIYGSRAAGGVIVITTKKGKVGKISIGYSFSSSLVLKPQRDAGLMNSKQKLDWEKKLWDTYSKPHYVDDDSYLPVIGLVGMVRAGRDDFTKMSSAEREDFINKKYDTNTDWFEELFRNSLTTNQHVSISGGTEKLRVYASLGYSQNTGLVKKTDYDRINLSTNLTAKFNDKFNLNFSISASNQVANGYSASVDPFKYAYFANPYERPYNEDGEYEPDYTYWNFKANNQDPLNTTPTIMARPRNGFNIMREINDTDSKTENTSITTNASLTYHIAKNFHLNTIASYSYTTSNTENFKGKYTYAAFQDRCSFDSDDSDKLYSSFMTSDGRNKSYTLRAQLSYNKTIGENHKFSVIGGSEVRESNATAGFRKKYNYNKRVEIASMPIPDRVIGSDNVTYSSMVSYGNLVDGLFGEGTTQHRFASFYTSMDYDYKNKYIASFTVRADGSDCFGSEEQFNKNWSLGFVWHAAKENFMIPYKHIISSLSLRAATGYTGNVNKTVSPEIILVYDNKYRKTEDDTYLMSRMASAPNKNLRWEKTMDAKLGLSLGLFEGRISMNTEVYYRKSTDLVNSVTVPSVTGYNTQGYNTSEMENKGFEFSLSATPVKTKDFRWSTSMNFGKNISKLVKYNSPYGKSMTSALRIGYPTGSIFTGKPLGINPKTGYYEFKLRPDADISKQGSKSNPENYLFYIGTQTPPIQGGFSNSLSYKNFSLSIYGNYCFGNKMNTKLATPSSVSDIFSGTSVSTTEALNHDIQSYLNDVYHHHHNMNAKYRDVWTPDNPNARYPILIDDVADRSIDKNAELNQVMDSRVVNGAFIEKMWYVRIKSISLSYSVPSKFIKKYNISSMSVNMGISNPFTFTDYSGIDPESAGAVYPITRTVNFGFNLSF